MKKAKKLFRDNEPNCSEDSPPQIRVAFFGAWYVIKQRPHYFAEMFHRCGCHVTVATQKGIFTRPQYRHNDTNVDRIISRVVMPGKTLLKKKWARWFLWSIRWIFGIVDVVSAVLYEKKCRKLSDNVDITIVHCLGYWKESWPKTGGVVYDCMDDWPAFENGPIAQKIEQQERQLLQAADTVWVVSDPLVPLLQDRYGYTGAITIRNGVDLTSYSESCPVRSKSEVKSEAIYIGTIASWFDLELFKDAALLTPDIRYTIVGPIERGLNKAIEQMPANVRFTGSVPYSDIPGLVGLATVGLIPFRVNPLTKSTNPLKLYEYWASGKPVVATPMPEVEAYETPGIVYIARDAEGFAKAVKEACATSLDSALIQERKKLAMQNCWEARFLTMCKSLEGLLPSQKKDWLVKKATELLEHEKSNSGI